jgi:hypothetical protein
VGGLPLHRRHGERDNYSKVETLVGGILFSAYNEILNLSPLLMSVAILLKFQLVSSVIQDFTERLRDSGQEICRRLWNPEISYLARQSMVMRAATWNGRNLCISESLMAVAREWAEN